MKEMIVAHGLNNEIGYNNGLIWNYKEDLQYFRKQTLHKNVIMGRKTFQSLPFGPLSHRRNIVLTSTITHEGIEAHTTLESVLSSYRSFVVIGGSEIYKQCIDLIDTLYVSVIPQTFNKADAFFVDNYKTKFKLTTQTISTETGIEYNTYTRL